MPINRRNMLFTFILLLYVDFLFTELQEGGNLVKGKEMSREEN